MIFQRQALWVRLSWICLFSLVFYSCWSPFDLVFLLGSIAINFYFGRTLATPDRKYRFAILSTGVSFNLLLLAYFKYYGFLLENFNYLVGSSWSIPAIALPLAISFHTFQQIAYLVDVFRNTSNVEQSPLRYLFFVSFFPQLIAGPIVSHQTIRSELLRPGALRLSWQYAGQGVTIFVLGLFKKVVIADNLATGADGIFSAAVAGETLGCLASWIGVLSYSFQIYFDFSGYSDMALGIALLIGVHLPLNFTSPYKATSIIDFWRSWHITLSHFLRDYLYIPLGGNRNGIFRRYTNLLITMLLGGLWHGASWNFVIWGGLHGCYLIINHLIRSFGRRANGAYRFFGAIITFFAVSFAWIFFRAETFAAASHLIGQLFTMAPHDMTILQQWEENILRVFGYTSEQRNLNLPESILSALTLTQIAVLAEASMVAFLLPTSWDFVMRTGAESVNFKRSLLSLRWNPSPLWALTFSLLFLWAFAGVGGKREFLYFQF